MLRNLINSYVRFILCFYWIVVEMIDANLITVSLYLLNVRIKKRTYKF